MRESLARIADLPVPLSMKLWLLRLVSRQKGARHEKLSQWASEHPAVASRKGWHSKAWWGVAAGELVRDHLFDPSRRAAALDLVEHVDTAALDATLRQGKGVIIAAAHLGPPKFLMNWLLAQQLPLLVWTNTADMPTWQAEANDRVFLNPLYQDQRSMLLAKSALHLRRGGVLFGAADVSTGNRVITIERKGFSRGFSLGLPTLARKVGVPVVTALALWHGNRIRIRFTPLELPDSDLPDDDWNRLWLERYWAMAVPLLNSSPENLRFLREFVKLTANSVSQQSSGAFR